jgi:Caspase domain
VIGWWANGVIQAQREVAHEAAREDIRGQIVAYAAAFGSMEMDVVEGLSTSPYTTPLVQKLRQKKNVVEAIVDAHKYVLEGSHSVQRPLLSTSLNGQIYLHRQPPTRRKRVLAISVDEPGAGVSRLKGPPHDVEAFTSILLELGFSRNDTIILPNPDRTEIEAAIDKIKNGFRQRVDVGPRVRDEQLLVRVGLKYEEPAAAPAPDNTLFVLFFSGHGVHIRDKDYIIPRLSPHIDSVKSPDDVERVAVNVAWLTRAAEETAAASIVILDTHFPTVSFDSSR